MIEPTRPKLDDADLWIAAGFDRSTLTTISAEQDWLLVIASRDPAIGVLSTAVAIEAALRTLAGDLGVDGYASANVLDLINALVRRGALTLELSTSLQAFLGVRGRLAHGQSVEGTDTTLTSGLELLYLLRTIPRPVHRAVQMVTMYTDPGGLHEATGLRGVLLATADEPGPQPSSIRVFPTRRVYLTGQRLSWTWNVGVAVGPMWYKDPISQEMTKGWDRSAEFVGGVLADPIAGRLRSDVLPRQAEALALFQQSIESFFKMHGFSVERPTSDMGVDLIVERDNLKWIMEFKFSSRPIGVAAVTELHATRTKAGADYAIMVTTGPITPGASEYADRVDVQILPAHTAYEYLTRELAMLETGKDTTSG